MKLSGQFSIPVALAPVITDTSSHQKKLLADVIHTLSAERDSSAHTARHAYPEATPEERNNISLKFGRSKVGRARDRSRTRDQIKDKDRNTDKGKVKDKNKNKNNDTYKRTPQKLPGGPNSPGNAVHNSHTINNLQRRGYFPALPEGLGTIARNAIVEATLNGLIKLGFTAAQHVVSDVMEQRIKAQAEMPGAEKKNADGTKSTVNPSATEQQKIDARVEGAEINVELLANSIISINEGPDAPAVGKSPNAPTTTQERLDNLEKTLDAVEGPLEDIAKRYGQVYTRPSAADSSAPSTPQSRLDRIEQRYAEMNKMLKRLVAVKNAEAEDTE